MKKIRLAYSSLKNAGDALNVSIIEKLTNRKVVRSKVYNADMMAIGGALFGAQYSRGFRGVLQKILHLIYGNKPLYVWGSGFLYGDNDAGFYRSNLKICALRGEETRKKVSKITGKKYDDVVLADAGLLADMFLKEKIKKKYKIGIIPHFSQQDEPLFQSAKKDKDILFIDIRKTPEEVIKEIASCEYIASSSLHGLIFADSLHIPSLRIIGRTELPGGEFKFKDYYSCYHVKDNPWRSSKKLPTVEDIKKRACVDFNLVDKKKKELLNCFPERWKGTR